MIRITQWSSVVLLVIAIAQPMGARAADWHATIHRDGSGATIPGLNLTDDSLQVVVDDRPQVPVIRASITGTYVQNQSGWSLSTVSEELATTKGGDKKDFSFTAHFPLGGPDTVIEFVAVGPSGDLRKQSITVHIDSWEALNESAKQSALSRSRFSAGLGVESISLKDSRIPDTSEIGLGLRAGWFRPFAETPWSIQADGSITAATFNSSTTFDYRLMTLSATGNYRLPFLSDPWGLLIGAGYFYETTFSSATKGGFKNLDGPVARLTGQREISDGRSASLAVSYLNSNFSSSGTVGFAGEYHTSIMDARPLTLALEYSTLNLTIQTVKFTQNVFTVLGKIGL